MICFSFLLKGLTLYQSPTRCSTYFKIDMTIWKTIGTTLIEEVNIFDQEAEERYHNLRKEQHYSQSGPESKHNALQRKIKGSQVVQKVSKIPKD